MPELAERRSVLADAVRPGQFGVREGTSAGVTLIVRPPRNIVQVAADEANYGRFAERLRATMALDLPKSAHATGKAGEVTALWVGPGRAYIVAPEQREVAREVEAIAAGIEVAITELSHSRTAIGICGPHARDLLAAGSDLDFHPRKFAVGVCQQSNYGQVACLFHALDALPSFDLYVYRGFALSLWQMLATGALQYGYIAQV